jgi:hypothetical protein
MKSYHVSDLDPAAGELRRKVFPDCMLVDGPGEMEEDYKGGPRIEVVKACVAQGGRGRNEWHLIFDIFVDLMYFLFIYLPFGGSLLTKEDKEL